jgi:hypothetical protein
MHVFDMCTQALGQKDVMRVHDNDNSTANTDEVVNNSCDASEAAINASRAIQSDAVPKTSKAVTSSTAVSKRLLFSWSELDNVREVYADKLLNQSCACSLLHVEVDAASCIDYNTV